MRRRKMKKWPIIVLILIIVGIITLISTVAITKYIHKINSYEYKLEQIGYKSEEISTLKKKLNNKQLDIVLTKKYSKRIPQFIKEKYFIFDNLDKYLKYDQELEKDQEYTDIVAIINVGSNKEWYTDTKEIDKSLEEKMLVNKFHNLTEQYQPDDLIQISNQYAYGTDQSLRKAAYDSFINMFNDAKKESITLIVNSSYRSYESQKQVYDDYSSWYGEEETDKIAARPGFSEHQTGYAVDIQTYNSTRDNFEESDAFKWLQNNAYKYGFILRYPKDKEYLTGYDYESWHYRYVGQEIAKYIQKNKITYDEYYAYYVEKN